MIPIEALRSVRRCVVHGNCADGRASAVILHAALPDAEIIEVTHDSAAHRAIEPVGDVLFCDMVPWLPKGDEGVAMLAEWSASGAIVLDHHEGTRDIVAAFGDRGAFGDNAQCESGAWLALYEVLRPMRPEHLRAMDFWFLARLVAIRDTWQRSSLDWRPACEASEVLRFLPLHECLSRGASGILSLANDIGGVLWTKKQKTAEKAAAGAVRMVIAGRRVAVISSTKLTSDVADVLGDEVDIVAGFDYIHEDGGVVLQCSIRSKTGVDVSAIARENGGNGHKPAAGFNVPMRASDNVVLYKADPYDIISHALAK